MAPAKAPAGPKTYSPNMAWVMLKPLLELVILLDLQKGHIVSAIFSPALSEKSFLC
jgi:hypothetical protein